MTKTYPNRTLETALRNRSIPYRLLWEIKGPPNTQIAWLTAYAIGKGVCILQTFVDGGWEAYTHDAFNDAGKAVDDVVARLEAAPMEVSYG
jgi:hypothetical protein